MYGAMRRDADPDAVGEASSMPLAVGLEARRQLLGAGAEDLEVDDRPQAELGHGRVRPRRRSSRRRSS